MEVTYELDSDDLEAFFAHHARHAPYLAASIRRMRRFWAAAFGALAIVFAPVSTMGSILVLAVGLPLLATYGSLNRWWYVRHNRRLHGGADGARPGKTALTVAGGRLTIDAAEGVSTLPLSSVRRIDESGTYYFIYVGPVTAVILPKSIEDAAAFISTLRAAHAVA